MCRDSRRWQSPASPNHNESHDECDNEDGTRGYCRHSTPEDPSVHWHGADDRRFHHERRRCVRLYHWGNERVATSDSVAFLFVASFLAFLCVPKWQIRHPNPSTVAAWPGLSALHEHPPSNHPAPRRYEAQPEQQTRRRWPTRFGAALSSRFREKEQIAAERETLRPSPARVGRGCGLRSRGRRSLALLCARVGIGASHSRPLRHCMRAQGRPWRADVALRDERRCLAVSPRVRIRERAGRSGCVRSGHSL